MMDESGAAASKALDNWNRFTAIPRWAAAVVLAITLGLIILGSVGKTGESHVKGANSTAMKANGLVGDHALYSEIVRRVSEGEPYYQAATAEQRENSYPTKPFMTVRLPTHAHILAFLGEKVVTLLGLALAAVMIIFARRRIMAEPLTPSYARLGALFIAANSIVQLASRSWVYMHESITGILMAFALFAYQRDRQWPALLIMVITVMIRETALPVAIVFGLFALWDRNWRAVGAWLLLGFAFLAVIYLHIQALNAVVLPNDLSSPGWKSSGGWLGYTSFLYKTSVLRYVPGWVAAILIPLSFLGWAAWKARLGQIGFAIHLVYAVIFVSIARPDNFYWGVLLVPTFFVGLIFAPAALWALFQSLRYGRAGPPAAQTA
jgi:hypothetical protein